MAIVYFDVSMSLDGFIAGPNVGVENPLGDSGELLHEWMFAGKTDEESVEFEEQLFRPCGAMLIGRRMLDVGIGPWGDDPTFHMPVYVLTHRPHEPVVKHGGTTYYFLTGSLLSAIEQARDAADGKDVAGPGEVIHLTFKVSQPTGSVSDR
jgi:dihydrofolate reductase